MHWWENSTGAYRPHQLQLFAHPIWKLVAYTFRSGRWASLWSKVYCVPIFIVVQHLSNICDVTAAYAFNMYGLSGVNSREDRVPHLHSESGSRFWTWLSTFHSPRWHWWPRWLPANLIYGHNHAPKHTTLTRLTPNTRPNLRDQICNSWNGPGCACGPYPQHQDMDNGL